MRISDWSSDVCSSDLVARRLTQPRFAFAARARFCDAESARDIGIAAAIDADEGGGDALRQKGEDEPRGGIGGGERLAHMGMGIDEADRKSTRLNSSH